MNSGKPVGRKAGKNHNLARGYSGIDYWEAYHEVGISKVTNRTSKQEKWLYSLVPVLQQHNAVNVLDLGCGSGYDALAMAELGFTVSGCDISQHAIDHAIQQAAEAGKAINYQQHDIAQSLPYPDSSFDAVICNLTLHMFPADVADEIVNEVSRCLAPSGLFLFHVNSTEDLPYRSKLQPPVVPLADDMFRLGSGQSMRFFSEQACRNLLEGWAVLTIEPVQMLREDGGVQKCAWRCIGQKS
jgi:SAM-dependent methyltransferase